MRFARPFSLACAALLVPLIAAAAPPPEKQPEKPAERTTRSSPMSRQLDEIEQELRRFEESLKKTARELDKETQETARKARQRAGAELEKETQRVLPEVRERLRELQRGLDEALSDIERTLERDAYASVSGRVEKLEGRALTVKPSGKGPSVFQLDDRTLVRRGGDQVSILALEQGVDVLVGYETKGAQHVARRIDIVVPAR
ncbi:MAG: hypothetical protein ACK4N5_06950 [Myxococcales bacterium]